MTGTPRDRDIILEAINTYDDWMLDDDYEPGLVLTRIIQRMRDRIIEQSLDTMAKDGGLSEDYKTWYNEAIEAANAAGYGPCSAAEAIRMLGEDLRESRFTSVVKMEAPSGSALLLHFKDQESAGKMHSRIAYDMGQWGA